MRGLCTRAPAPVATDQVLGVTDSCLHTSRVAPLLESGVPYALLRRVDLDRPFAGVRRPHVPDPNVLTRVRDAAALLGPDGALGGWAAAYWQGARTLDGRGSGGGALEVLLHPGSGEQLRRRPGIDPTRARLRPDQLTVFADQLVTTLPRALYDEMRLAPSLAEAVAVLDVGVSRLIKHAHTSLSGVQRLVDGEHKTRGIVQARAALAMGSERCMSRGESRLRVFADGAGPNGLLVNAPLFDERRRLVAVVDLLDEESGLVLEYDGEDHRKRVRHEADNEREERVEDLNLVVVRAGGLALRQPAALDRRIATGRARGVARDRGQDRWTTVPPAWWPGSVHARRWGYPPWR